MKRTRKTQVCTTISEYTRRQIDELRPTFGTVRETITRAVDLLYQQSQHAGYQPEPYLIKLKVGDTLMETGGHLWEMAGDCSIAEMIDKAGGMWEAALDAATVLGKTVRVYSEDNKELNIPALIYYYLQHASAA